MNSGVTISPNLQWIWGTYSPPASCLMPHAGFCSETPSWGRGTPLLAALSAADCPATAETSHTSSGKKKKNKEDKSQGSTGAHKTYTVWGSQQDEESETTELPIALVCLPMASWI